MTLSFTTSYMVLNFALRASWLIMHKPITVTHAINTRYNAVKGREKEKIYFFWFVCFFFVCFCCSGLLRINKAHKKKSVIDDPIHKERWGGGVSACFDELGKSGRWFSPLLTLFVGGIVLIKNAWYLCWRKLCLGEREEGLFFVCFILFGWIWFDFVFCYVFSHLLFLSCCSHHPCLVCWLMMILNSYHHHDWDVKLEEEREKNTTTLTAYWRPLWHCCKADIKSPHAEGLVVFVERQFW